MDVIFNACVRILVGLGHLTGLSYEGVNVVIFVIFLPIGLLGLVARTVWLERQLSADGRARELTLPAVQIVFWSLVLIFILALSVV
jgi:hypothetical protein